MYLCAVGKLAPLPTGRVGWGRPPVKEAMVLPLTKRELCTAKNKRVLRALLIFMQPFDNIFLGIISFGYQGIVL